MLYDFHTEYESKLTTPEEAVKVVKSGDWIDYTSCLGKPVLLDRALAKRKEELFFSAIFLSVSVGKIALLPINGSCSPSTI